MFTAQADSEHALNFYNVYSTATEYGSDMW